MPGDPHENRKSRRMFLGAAAIEATSLMVTGGKATETESAQSTVRDCMWIFTVPAGLDNANLEKGNIHGGSRMTPAEAAFYLDVPNLLLIRSCGLPTLPNKEQGRTKTSFQQYATSFRSLDRVVWSVVGATGKNGGMAELDYVLPLAKEFPNISGVYLDDFVIDAKKQADGRAVGRPAMSPGDLKIVRERLKAAGRPIETWVTLYTYNLLPKHPDYIGCDPPLAGFLDLFDVLTLWTWNADELPGLAESMAALEAIAPKHRRIALGMYLWDYYNARPVPIPLMRHQCELGLKWLKEKRIQELIFLGNTSLDVGLPSVEYARNWIKEVGAQSL